MKEPFPNITVRNKGKSIRIRINQEKINYKEKEKHNRNNKMKKDYCQLNQSVFFVEKVKLMIMKKN